MYGYLVRLYRGKGVLFQEWLSDNKYGGKENAFEEAKAIRDKKIADLNYYPGNGHTNREWKPVQNKRSARSNTGHTGVYESYEYKKLKDGTKKKSSYIAASYVEDKGKPKIKKFYFGEKRDRDQALKEAIKFRGAKEMSLRAAAVEYNRELQKRLIEAENKLAVDRRKTARKQKQARAKV